MSVVVAEHAGGERVDRYLARTLDRPRNQVRQWIDDGRVRVAGALVKGSTRVEVGDRVEFRVPPPRNVAGLVPEPGPLDILYEDDHLVAVDKPPDLIVHPGAGHETGTLAHRLLHRFPEMARLGGPGRPGIVHRLDKDTSGVLLAARSEPAYRALTRAFADRTIEKRYLALVHGVPARSTGTIDEPIGRHRTKRKEMAVRFDGRASLTTYETLATSGRSSLLGIQIETGRTHQIRVHLKSIRHPIIGDPVYGEARWKELAGRGRRAAAAFGRPALHAWRLRFLHPVEGTSLEILAPVPADLRGLWADLGGLETSWPA